jgi:hypothetical protein
MVWLPPRALCPATGDTTLAAIPVQKVEPEIVVRFYNILDD